MLVAIPIPAYSHALQTKYTFTFGQIYVSKPSHTEPDDSNIPLTPNAARLRDLTYHSCLFVDANIQREEEDGTTTRDVVSQIHIGRIPIMLRSKYCILSETDISAGDMYGFKECPLDTGGYFVVNGTEKVIIAQERMATNNVYVFERKEAKYLFVAEIRSVLENSPRPAAPMLMKLLRGGPKNKSVFGQAIRTTVPYVKTDIPVMIVFRALGFVSDRDILQHIIYDFEDQEMMEMLKPSLDEAIMYQEQNVSWRGCCSCRWSLFRHCVR